MNSMTTRSYSSIPTGLRPIAQVLATAGHWPLRSTLWKVVQQRCQGQRARTLRRESVQPTGPGPRGRASPGGAGIRDEPGRFPTHSKRYSCGRRASDFLADERLHVDGCPIGCVLSCLASCSPSSKSPEAPPVWMDTTLLIPINSGKPNKASPVCSYSKTSPWSATGCHVEC
jgi:hypothetical protein